jgi:hypothetical protein
MMKKKYGAGFYCVILGQHARQVSVDLPFKSSLLLGVSRLKNNNEKEKKIMIKSVVGLFLNVRNLSPMSCEAH